MTSIGFAREYPMFENMSVVKSDRFRNRQGTNVTDRILGKCRSQTTLRLIMNQRIAKTLPRFAIDILVFLRSIGFLVLEPIDRFGLLINHKTALPPLRLRRYVGSLARFEASAAEYASYLKLLANLKSDSEILDIGCGCGLLALELEDYLVAGTGGRYVGIDIHKPSIAWCQKHFSPEHFQFIHHDIFNATFNPAGYISPAEFSLSADTGLFDVIVAKSLFTHITPVMAQRYLQIINKHLKDDGVCIISAFLFDDATSAKGDIDFRYGSAEFRYAYQNRIESAVAYRHDYFLDLISSCGLMLDRPIYRGGWYQPQNALNYQDIIVLRHHP